MSRSLPAECNTPEWNQMMHDFTVKHAVEHQVRPVLARHNSNRYTWDRKPVIRSAFPQWHDDFIIDCLKELDRQDRVPDTIEF